MSLLLRRLWRLGLGRPATMRSSVVSANGFSTSSRQSPPCSITGAYRCGAELGRLVVSYADDSSHGYLEKKVPIELFRSDAVVTIGASHGWIATLKEDGVLRLQDDFNPVASDTNPKRIPLPPLVTLPRCQTQILTNVSMSSASPEDEDCVVAVKFLGPQLSFCRPALSNSEWTNIRIQHPCFYSSRIMFSKKDNMFRIPGSGGHLIASWDLRSDKQHKPKLQRLRFRNLPGLRKTKRTLLDSCFTSEHLVESTATGETFMVKLYRKAAPKTINGMVKMKTKAVMVFNIDDKGNAVYTEDIGDLCIFLSKSEPFCVPASSFPGMDANSVEISDEDEDAIANLTSSSIIGGNNIFEFRNAYDIPPQKLD